MPAASPTDIHAKLVRTWVETTLQRSHHRRGDAGRVPVHAHHRTERLKPERVAQPRKQRRSAVVIEHALADRRTEHRHSRGEPFGHASVVQGQIGETGTFHPSTFLVLTS